METKYKVGIAVASLAVSFAAGRYTLPEKIKTETKYVEVERKDTDKKVTKDVTVKRNRKVRVLPDGTREMEVTTEIGDKSKEHEKTAEEKNRQGDSKNEVTGPTQKTTIAVMVGSSINLNQVFTTIIPDLQVGAQVYRPVLGPIGVGVFGLVNTSLTNLTAGASIGISL